MQFFIDFEATQFSERIINIGCVASNGATFSTLVKPVMKKDKVNKFITELTGITNEMLENAPTADEAFNLFFDFVLAQGHYGLHQYYCYGNSDAQFIERTVSHMNDARAITFAKMLHHELIDFSKDVKLFFQMSNNIALRKVYSLIQNDNVEQHHNALEDAQMLYEVVMNLTTKCVVEDKAKFANMPKTIKPIGKNRLNKAPEKFLNWPNDKWAADTGADETNWKVIAWVGPHTKYFDSVETAMMWVIRYLAKNTSIKNLDHQKMVIERIEYGAKTGKQPYSFNWSIKE
jgi:DNA polymerase III epsilon subunit-like protein